MMVVRNKQETLAWNSGKLEEIRDSEGHQTESVSGSMKASPKV